MMAWEAMMDRKWHYLEMARIWFSNAFGTRSAEQKRNCERLGWYYLLCGAAGVEL